MYFCAATPAAKRKAFLAAVTSASSAANVSVEGADMDGAALIRSSATFLAAGNREICPFMARLKSISTMSIRLISLVPS